MATFGRWRKFASVAAVLVIALAASSSGQPPQPPGLPQPVLPPLPPAATPVVPVNPLDEVKKPLVLPPLPAPPGGFPVVPTVPPAPPPAISVAPPVPNPPALEFPAAVTKPAVQAPPVEPEIVEPVVSVHRFAGKYLGGDDRHALVYVEIGAGKAEVQRRPLNNTIPPADGHEKPEVKRLEVPVGKVTSHDGRAFVTTARVDRGRQRLRYRLAVHPTRPRRQRRIVP